MKKFYPLIIIILLIVQKKSFGQDFTFSQFYEQPLMRNPALAGVFTGDLRVSGAYRNQWASVTVPFKTTALSIEKKNSFGNANDFLTTSIQLSNDVAGDIRLKRTQILPAINYHKSLSEENDTYLSLGFMGGLVSNQFDPTQMRLADQWQNGSFNSSNATRQKIERSGFNYWDASTGLTFSSSYDEDTRYYLGAALYHFNKPKVAFNNIANEVYLQQRWVLNAGLSRKTSDYTKLIAFADYLIQGGNRQLLGGVMFGTDVSQSYEDENENVTLYAGAFMRWKDALIPMVKIEMKNLSIGVSYDVNISKLTVASKWRGGLEMTVSYKGFLKIPSSSLEKLRCVRF
jgi:type IX secretion system PorP/SprF family membrane protein